MSDQSEGQCAMAENGRGRCDGDCSRLIHDGEECSGRIAGAASVQSNTMADWEARCSEAHASEIAQGLHDDQCEYGRRLKRSLLMLCNCSKRRRELAGFTTPPSDDLYFPPPDCPKCDGGLDHDGDSWDCYVCCLSWDSNGSGNSCRFTDDHGDLAGSEAA